jgi:hypothetical protein
MDVIIINHQKYLSFLLSLYVSCLSLEETLNQRFGKIRTRLIPILFSFVYILYLEVEVSIGFKYVANRFFSLQFVDQRAIGSTASIN